MAIGNLAANEYNLKFLASWMICLMPPIGDASIRSTPMAMQKTLTNHVSQKPPKNHSRLLKKGKRHADEHGDQVSSEMKGFNSSLIILDAWLLWKHRTTIIVCLI
jgi:hypothetical protein